MAGWIVGIYILLGIALVVFCECTHLFDDCIETYNELYDLELGDVSTMAVKGLLQVVYMLLWWVVLIVTAVYVVNNR